MKPTALVVLVLLAGCGATGATTATPTTATPTTANQEAPTMQITSPAFTDGATVPVRYTCDGDDVSPPLHVDAIPTGAAAFVLIMDDPDAPGGTWDHWVAYDVPLVADIPENVADLGTAGSNSWGRTGYGGPCPPGGTHRYVFAVFAVSRPTGLPAGATKADVYAAMADTVLAEARITGRYSR